MHTICTLYAYHMHAVYISYAHECTPHAHYMYTVCISYAHYMHTTCTLYAHHMNAVYTLYEHFILGSCLVSCFKMAVLYYFSTSIQIITTFRNQTPYLNHL